MEPRRWAFNENAVERPAKDRDEGDNKAAHRNMSIFAAGLKPDDAECADQSKKCSDLKPPLSDYEAFFREKYEREESGEDDGRAPEDRVDAGADIKKRDDLGDLVNDIWKTWYQTERDRADVDLGSTAELKKNERNNGEAGDEITVKILRPRIVETIQVILKKGRQRPDDDGGEDCGVSARELARASCHEANCGTASRFSQVRAGLAQICWLAGR